MKLKDIAEKEYTGLDKLANDYLQHVERVLVGIRKAEVKLWLTKQDQYRLLTLRAWETKYKLSTQDILQILPPFWESFVQRRSKNIKRSGLNVKVSTLVGKKSELILKDQIQRQYPNNENILLYASTKKEEIIQNYLKQLEKKSDDGVRSLSDPSRMYAEDGKPKNLTDFPTPDAFIKYYRKYMKKEQLVREQVETMFKKYNYRGNPFKRELL